MNEIAAVPYTAYKWFQENRAEVSSWAVWANPPEVLDPDVGLTTHGVGEVGFFDVSDEAEYRTGVGQALRQDIVIIVLNPAAREDKDGLLQRDDRLFGCFHDNHPQQVKDHRLRAIAYHWGLWGGLIVDLDPITVETSSEVAAAKLRDDPDHRETCARLLGEALTELAPPRDALVVYQGGKVEEIARKAEFAEVLATHFDSVPRTIWHYSHYGVTLQDRMDNALKVLGEKQPVSGLWVPGRSRRA